MSPERRRQVLMGVLATAVVLAGWRYLGAPADAPAAAATARRAAPAIAPVPPVDLGLEALDEARTGPDEIERNPFVFGAREAAPSGPVDRRPDGPAGPPGPAPVALPGPPPLAPIPFKFIGLVEDAAGTRRIAVLSDSKGLVVHGAEGAIIDGRFRILSIGPESIEIAYADGRGRQMLRLSGQ
jgi:hypothetical protein